MNSGVNKKVAETNNAFKKLKVAKENTDVELEAKDVSKKLCAAFEAQLATFGGLIKGDQHNKGGFIKDVLADMRQDFESALDQAVAQLGNEEITDGDTIATRAKKFVDTMKSTYAVLTAKADDQLGERVEDHLKDAAQDPERTKGSIQNGLLYLYNGQAQVGLRCLVRDPSKVDGMLLELFGEAYKKVHDTHTQLSLADIAKSSVAVANTNLLKILMQDL